MEDNFLMFLIAQSVVIILAVVSAFVAVKVAVTRVEVQSVHNTERLVDLKQDHKKLSTKVDSISRHVVALEQMHRLCPYVKTEKDMFSDT